jgi:hypothetical protein
MKYIGLFTEQHVAVMFDWISQLGELFVLLDYPHSGGSGSGYFVRSLADVRKLISQQTSLEIDILVLRAIVFPVRGSVSPDLLERALQRIPDGQLYQVVTPDPYPMEYDCLADGRGHAQLREDFAKLEAGRHVAIGVHPFDPPWEQFVEFCGGPVETLRFQVHKNLNFYPEYGHNPEKYRAAIAEWFTSTPGD